MYRTRLRPRQRATGQALMLVALTLSVLMALVIGVTDLMLGFADFPETVMLERFAARVLPALTAAPPHR